ncbi:OST-HTH/LOTUS domain protein [compost metagenome]
MSNGEKQQPASSNDAAQEPNKSVAQPKKQKVPVDFIAKVIEDIDDEDGWVHLGALGSNISKLRPAFDARLYGFKKLSDLIKGHPKRFELQVRGSSTTGGEALYVRNRMVVKSD